MQWGRGQAWPLSSWGVASGVLCSVAWADTIVEEGLALELDEVSAVEFREIQRLTSVMQKGKSRSANPQVRGAGGGLVE